MKLIHPAAICHSGSCINSIDFHPDGSTVVTAGKSAYPKLDNMLVWKTQAIWDSNIKPEKPVLVLGHAGAVNCVRWSHSGTLLASGGDDALLAIWRRLDTGFAPLLKLQKHKDCVLHLDWSADDQLVATASADHSLMIWRVQGTTVGGERLICVLRGHSDAVNGCAWLRNNRLVSQANDMTLRVWDTDTKEQERSITEPFKGGAMITPYQRLAIAQDGTFILGVHALNGGGCTIQKIDSESLTPQVDYVGYRKPVSVVRFLPNRIRLPSGQSTMCWACGSNDRSVSLWFTHSRRPLFVIEELFTNSVFDLSLHRNDGGGIEMAACSKDGTVRCFSLTKHEIGDLDVQAETLAAVPVATAQPTQQKETVKDGRRRITAAFVPLSS